MSSLFWLLIPMLLTALRMTTNQYIFSPLITLACAALACRKGFAGGAWLLALGLVISAAGDWFMCHQKQDPNNFLRGVAGFGLAHLVFIAYAACRYRFSLPALLAILALGAAYWAYLNRSVLPGQTALMQRALLGYAAVSLLGLFFALSLKASGPEKCLYVLGIVSILFSDTMIAHCQFAGHRWAEAWILPTYYLCHLLLAASRLVR